MYELYHYGVKGMKWGVRKERANQRRVAKKLKSKIDTEEYRVTEYRSTGTTNRKGVMLNQYQKRLQQTDEVKQIHADLSSARQELKKTYEFASKFNNDKELVAKYQEKAARRLCEKIGVTDKKEIEGYIQSYKYSDLDQGSYSSFAEYCRDKKVNLYDYEYKCIKAQQAYEAECRRYTDALIGEYGNQKIKDVTTYSSNTISDAVYTALDWMSYSELYRSGHYMPH